MPPPFPGQSQDLNRCQHLHLRHCRSLPRCRFRSTRAMRPRSSDRRTSAVTSSALSRVGTRRATKAYTRSKFVSWSSAKGLGSRCAASINCRSSASGSIAFNLFSAGRLLQYLACYLTNDAARAKGYGPSMDFLVPYERIFRGACYPLASQCTPSLLPRCRTPAFSRPT